LWRSSKKLQTTAGANEGQQEKEEDEVQESRMYTVGQIRELFYLNLNRSEVRSKIAKAEKEIKVLKEETHNLKEQDNKIINLLE